MPGFGWSLPATECRTGSKLRVVPGSVCSKCYALRGRYVFDEVQNAMWRRKGKLRSLRVWTEDFVELLTRKGGERVRWFRWFDSGDLQSYSHLLAIVEIAARVPSTRFWLPTKEYGFVTRLMREGVEIPKNLVVRVSSPMIGQGPMRVAAPILTSTVGFAESKAQCPAYRQGGECLDCRACWDPKIPNANYPVH